jgi:hypothetical protein
MKKMRSIGIVACLLMASQAWAQSPKIKAQELLEKERNFRKEHKIKSVSEYKLENDEEEITKTLFRLDIYDENGFLVQSIEPQIEDSVRTIYQYNDQGFETMHTILGLDLVPIQTSTQYDERGRKIDGGSASAEVRRYKYVYDKSDNLVRQEGLTTYAAEDGSEGDWTVVDIDSFFYDNTGRVKESVTYYMGEETWREKLYYDKDGHLVKREGIRSENIELTEEYVYDEKELLVRHVSTDSDGTLYFEYEYEFF